MMSRRQFMARTSAAIGQLVTHPAVEPAERAGIHARMARYNRDCGCSMGGVFLVAAVLLLAVYLGVTTRFSVGVLGAGIAFVLVSSAVGKGVGLLVATVRLEVLRRSLSRRLSRMSGESHVYVH
jgi:hypothetical protein